MMMQLPPHTNTCSCPTFLPATAYQPVTAPPHKLLLLPCPLLPAHRSGLASLGTALFQACFFGMCAIAGLLLLPTLGRMFVLLPISWCRLMANKAMKSRCVCARVEGWGPAGANKAKKSMPG